MWERAAAAIRDADFRDADRGGTPLLQDGDRGQRPLPQVRLFPALLRFLHGRGFRHVKFELLDHGTDALQ